MIKAIRTFLLVLLAASSIIAQIPDQGRIDKVKASAAKYAGSGSTVEVKLQTGTRLKGKISTTAAETFDFNADSGGSSTIRYDTVAEINKKGGLSRGSWIAIVASAVGTVIAILVLRNLFFCDGGAGC